MIMVQIEILDALRFPPIAPFLFTFNDMFDNRFMVKAQPCAILFVSIFFLKRTDPKIVPSENNNGFPASESAILSSLLWR